MPNKNIHLLLVIALINLSVFAFGQETQADKASQWDAKIAKAQQLWADGLKDSTFTILLTLEAKGKELPEEIRWEIYRNLAWTLREVGELHSALKYKKKAIEIHPKRDSIPYVESERLAKYYNNIDKRDSAIHFTKLAVSRYSLGTTRRDTARGILMNNNIGYYYYLEGELDSAMVYYGKVATDFNEQRFPANYGIAIGNIAQIYFDRGDYQTALKFGKKELALSKIYVPESYLITLLLVARCSYQLNQLPTAENYLQTFFLEKKKNRNTDKTKEKNIDDGLVKQAYYLKAKIQYKLNKSKEAYKTLVLSHEFLDSLEKKQEENEQAISSFTNYRLESIRQKLELSKKEAALAKANELKKAAQVRFYLSLLISGFILLSLGFYYYRLNQKRKVKFKQLENELLKSELKNKRKDLTQLGIDLSNKRSFFNETNESLKEILKKPASEAQKNIQSLIHEFNHRASLDENLAALRTDIEKVNNSFFEKLGNEFPDLTRTEKEICGLLILNFSSKEIANIRNVTPNAVKKKRQIIRKKLPISSKENLPDFLLKYI